MEAPRPRWWHPRSTVQRIQRWWRRRAHREETFIVTIHSPRMRIEGNFLRNQRDNSLFITFLGIPYACPPVGPLRFQPPQPLPQNEEYQDLEAFYRKQPCLQMSVDGSAAVGSEDCLYLNIVIPTIPRNNPALLPVIFYIHGGGFVRGSSTYTEPQTLVRQNMVFVDLNYRLGIFGFLNMHTENCRGNAGMKDIVMALRWVKENIVHFGGDPENVTISGHSAGASAVNLLMVSPLAEGLFHKGIIMAGGIYTPWGYGGHAKDVKRLFVRHTDKNLTPYAVVELLKKEDPVNLLYWNQHGPKREQMEMEPRRICVFLRPSVECIEEGAFLPRNIEELMLNAKPMPTIAGITQKEGYMHFRNNPVNDLLNMVRNRVEFAKFLQQNLQWSEISTGRFCDNVREAYFPDLRNMQDGEVIKCLSTFITDVYYRRFYDSLKIGNQERPESAPLYVYLFDYFMGVAISPPEPLIIDGVQEAPIVREASEHGDDIKFVMNQSWIMRAIEERVPSYNRPNTREQALHVMRNMYELWTTFCRTGQPRSMLEGKVWLHHLESSPCYLHISRRLSMVNKRLFQDRWDYLNGICRLAAVNRPFETTRETTRRNIQRRGAMRDASRSFDETMNVLLL